MAAFIIYTIRWAVILTLLYSLYRLLLRRETFHRLNRAVLLAILVVSPLLPLIPLHTAEPTAIDDLDLLAERDALILDTARELKVQNTHAIATKASALQTQLKDMKRELDSANSKLSELKTASLIDSVKEVGAYKVLTARLDDVRPDAARGLCDTFKAKYPMGVVVFALVSDGKLNFVAAAGAEAVKAGAHAGKILSEVSAICGGKGGGRPDSAMSGGKEIGKISEALDKVYELLV